MVGLIKVPFDLCPTACGVVYIFCPLRERGWGKAWHWVSVSGNSVAMVWSPEIFPSCLWSIANFGLKLKWALGNPRLNICLCTNIIFL